MLTRLIEGAEDCVSWRVLSSIRIRGILRAQSAPPRLSHLRSKLEAFEIRRGADDHRAFDARLASLCRKHSLMTCSKGAECALGACRRGFRFARRAAATLCCCGRRRADSASKHAHVAVDAERASSTPCEPAGRSNLAQRRLARTPYAMTGRVPMATSLAAISAFRRPPAAQDTRRCRIFAVHVHGWAGRRASASRARVRPPSRRCAAAAEVSFRSTTIYGAASRSNSCKLARERYADLDTLTRQSAPTPSRRGAYFATNRPCPTIPSTTTSPR